MDIEDGESLENHPIVLPSSTKQNYSNSHDHRLRQSRPLKHGIRTRSRYDSSRSTQFGHNPTSYHNNKDDDQQNYYQNSSKSNIEFEYDDAAEKHHRRQRTPSPPPPPSNIGFIPTFFPETGQVQDENFDMPSGRRSILRSSEINTSFGTGVGAGALAAGAVIFGDDFISN